MGDEEGEGVGDMPGEGLGYRREGVSEECGVGVSGRAADGEVDGMS
mgnify:CR=1 FL=1